MTQRVRVEWTDIRLYFFFVDPDLLGQKIGLGTHDAFQVEIWLPTRNSEDEPGAGQRGGPDRTQVNRVKLVANTTTEVVSLVDAPGPACTKEQLEEATRLRASGTSAADRAVRNFLDLLALHHKVPNLTLLKGPTVQESDLYVGDPGKPVGYGFGTMRMTLFAPDTFTLDQLEDTARRVQSGESAPLAWLHFAEAYRELHLTGDVRHALITAAGAMEVGTKETLRKKVPGPMMELVLRAGRIEDLLKDVAEAALGESYAAADATNYRLLQDLQKQRNAVVHKGDLQPASIEEVARGLEAVYALLTWLDQRLA